MCQNETCTWRQLLGHQTAPTITTCTERVILGEGPHWDHEKQCLYFVDIFSQKIAKYDARTNRTTKARIDGGRTSFIVPVEGKPDQFLVSVGLKVMLVTWDGFTDRVSRMELVAQVRDDHADRFNDGKADMCGKLWLGTMGPALDVGVIEPLRGTLYSMRFNGVLESHMKKLSIPNGMAWSTDKMYFIDSPDRVIYEFPLPVPCPCEARPGMACLKKVVFSLDEHNIPGIPDGMTIDTEGMLWVAIYDGSRVIRVNPHTRELLNTIEMPVKQITSCTFGGPNLDILFVTSAQLPKDGQVQMDPAGAVFKVEGCGAKGFPGTKARISIKR